MKNIALIISILIMTFIYIPSASSTEQKIQLFMEDGQLKSHPFRLFITHDIDESMEPKLLLIGSHAISKKNKAEDRYIEPMLLAQKQSKEQVINDSKVTLTGTLLLFDLSRYPIPIYKTAMRLTPALTWKEHGMKSKRVAIGSAEIYLANPVSAFILPFIMILFFVLFIVIMARKGNKKAIQYISDSNGYLSLSRTQVALWTIVIGGMIIAYGLMRIDVPQIPSSLVALMGLSLATGGISYTQSDKKNETVKLVNTNKSIPVNSVMTFHSPKISDLVMNSNEEGNESLSLARAQMVFWTILTLILFIVKSILDGNLWAVPWELVALMGLSHIGYLAPKINLKTNDGK